MEDAQPAAEAMSPLPHPIPPAVGSQWDCWLDIALHPTRDRFIAWAQTATAHPRWVIQSVLVGAALDILGGGLTWTASLLVPPARWPRPSTGAISFYTSSLPRLATYDLAILPILSLAIFFAVAYAAALAMPPLGTSVRTRFVRVVRPWALAYVPNRALAVVMSAIGLAHVLVTYSHQSLPAVANLALVGISIAYSITLAVNALSVGANLTRWLAFWVFAGAALVVAVVFAIVGEIVFRLA